MKSLPIDLNEGLRSFTWSKDCILSHVDATTPSKAIYQAVCDEIGQFYQTKGFRYAPSNKKLQYQFEDFKFKLLFSSSHYNTVGEWIWVEISSGIYPIRLEKQYKEAKETLEAIILFNLGLLDQLIPDSAVGTVVNVNPLGEETETFEMGYPFALRKYSRSFNAYNITLEQFKKVLEYINKVIEYSFSLVLNESEMINHIKKSNNRNSKFYTEKRFADYLHLYYSQDSKINQFLDAPNED
jgi:hypothetical protein